MNMTDAKHIDTTAALARGAMLVDLSFSLWTGRKKNNTVSQEIVASKGARSRSAASVYNALLGDCKELEAVTSFVTGVRAKHMQLTLPWADTGTRLLPAPMLQRYQEFIQESRDRFDTLVLNFLARYDGLVAAAAFELGTMFDRNNYPERSVIQTRFDMRCSFSPVPLSNDFRVDLENEVMKDMAVQYEREMYRRMGEAQQDMWGRLHETLQHLADRLKVDEKGKPNIFRDSLVENALELVDLLKMLNPTNDPELEDARRRLASALDGKDADVLRKDITTRENTRKKVQEILDAFDFG